MKVYISGPIQALHNGDHPPEDIVSLRKERFFKCAQWIRDNLPGWEPVNPLEIQACEREGGITCFPDPDDLRGEHEWQCYLRYDLIEMLECEAIVLLPGSDYSPGSRLEGQVAESISMRHFWANEDGEVLA